MAWKASTRTQTTPIDLLHDADHLGDVGALAELAFLEAEQAVRRLLGSFLDAERSRICGSRSSGSRSGS